VTAAINLVAAMVLGGNGGKDTVQVDVPPPTAEPILAPIPTSTIEGSAGSASMITSILMTGRPPTSSFAINEQ